MVVRAHLIEPLKPFRLFHRPEFRGVLGPRWGEFPPPPVGHWHLIERRRKQVRTFGDRASHQNSSGAAPANRQLRRRSIFLIDQILRAGNRILPGVGLGQFLARQMPLFSVFAAAPHMRKRPNSSALVPRQKNWIEERIFGNSVRPVTVEYRWIRSVQLGSFFIYDR